MQFSGKTYIKFPKVDKFSFDIKNLTISNLNPAFFSFIDKDLNGFSFTFSGGFILADKIICPYNNKEFLNIKGYYENSIFNYEIDGIYSKFEVNLNKLNAFIISAEQNLISCDLLFNSNPINYFVDFNPIYSVGNQLTGFIYSDTEFDIKNHSFKFLNSEDNILSPILLENTVYTGTKNYLILQDKDSSNYEYDNSFILYADTIFDQLNLNKNSYRGNLYSKNYLNIDEVSTNNYFGSTLYNGFWSGNQFVYSGNDAEVNLFFNLENFDFFGNENKKTYVGISFQDLFRYGLIENITGFKLTNNGLYSGKEPNLKFSKYYYVEGISQNLQDLLFSTGCPDKLQIAYYLEDDENYIEARGNLDLRNVSVSGVYGNGINKFKAAFKYNPISKGLGYSEIPKTIWATGGNCFSIPDVYGESGQFKKIHNTNCKAISHADYLTGLSLTSGITGMNGQITGYTVTGIKITNIGSGYNQTYPAKVFFIRSNEDSLNNDASGIFYHDNPKNITIPPVSKYQDIQFIKDSSAFYYGSVDADFSFLVFGYKNIKEQRIFSYPTRFSGKYQSNNNINYYLSFSWTPSSIYDGYYVVFEKDMYFTRTSYASYGAILNGYQNTNIEIGRYFATTYVTQINNFYQYIDEATYSFRNVVYNPIIYPEQKDNIVKNAYKVSYNFLDDNEVNLEYRGYPYSYFYSNFEKPFGKNIINIKIKQNYSNDIPIPYTLLELHLSDKYFNFLDQNYNEEGIKVIYNFISFYKTFNTDTGALIL